MKSKFSITLMKLNTHIYLVFAFFLAYVTASSFLESGLSEFDYFVIGCCILYFVSYFIVLKKCRYSRVLSVALNLTMVLIINMKIFMLIAFSVSGIDVEIGSVFTIHNIAILAITIFLVMMVFIMNSQVIRDYFDQGKSC